MNKVIRTNGLYIVRDTVANIDGPVMQAANDRVAVRTFKGMEIPEKQDYELHKIATIEFLEGEIVDIKQDFVLLISGKEISTEEEKENEKNY